MWSEARDRVERKRRTKARAVFIVGCMRSDGEVVAVSQRPGVPIQVAAVSQRTTVSGSIPPGFICLSRVG